MAARGESERLTRKKRIDPKLKSQGWTVVAYDDEASLAEYACHAIEEYPTDAGPADIELKDKLRSAPQRFTMENLQKAHEAGYKKALVEIISMVKHATDEAQPLYTPEERVGRAFDDVTGGLTFTEQQQEWLDRIRRHLIENLSIEQQDFDVIPVFEQAGEWARADRAFGGMLEDVLARLNEAVAA